ncbi:MAG: glycosyltransferase family 2 protein, partial [Planctomycetales bacterium]|nr:glycosyltransferase family 2 protein [Planctomycetales bacterium]
MSLAPAVTALVVSYDGASRLAEGIPSLLALEPPEGGLEVVVVANGSTDGTAEKLREAFPAVRVIRHRRNRGYARPHNEAARGIASEWLAIVNDDVRVEPGWLRALLARAQATGADAVGSLLLSWDGATVDFAGGTVNAEGRGFQAGFGKPRSEVPLAAGPTLFACSAAMVVRREAFLEAGGFDERLDWFYVDVDLGWRFAVSGRRVEFEPEAVAYHRHGATAHRLPPARKLFSLERNGLASLLKNRAEDRVGPALAASLLLAGARAAALSGVPRETFAFVGPAEPSGAPPQESRLAIP